MSLQPHTLAAQRQDQPAQVLKHHVTQILRRPYNNGFSMFGQVAAMFQEAAENDIQIDLFGSGSHTRLLPLLIQLLDEYEHRDTGKDEIVMFLPLLCDLIRGQMSVGTAVVKLFRNNQLAWLVNDKLQESKWRSEVAIALVEAGADVNQELFYKSEPCSILLNWLSNKPKDVEGIMVLLRHGAAPAPWKNRNNFLHQLVEYNNTELLLACCEDKEAALALAPSLLAVNEEGLTPLRLANKYCRYKFPPLLNWLQNINWLPWKREARTQIQVHLIPDLANIVESFLSMDDLPLG